MAVIKFLIIFATQQTFAIVSPFSLASCRLLSEVTSAVLPLSPLLPSVASAGLGCAPLSVRRRRLSASLRSRSVCGSPLLNQLLMSNDNMYIYKHFLDLYLASGQHLQVFKINALYSVKECHYIHKYAWITCRELF
jgi:hypothetical protein